MPTATDRRTVAGFVLPLVWVAARGVYVDATGREVPRAVVRQVLGTALADSADRLGILAERWRDDALDTPAWRTAANQELRTGYGLAAALAAGGVAALLAGAGLDRLQAQLHTAEGYLQDLGTARAAGEVSDAQLAQRAPMYAGGMWSVFEEVTRVAAADRGQVYERNVLEEGAAHCEQCLELTDAGWQPVGSLDLPGARLCLSNCRCTLEYADEATVQGEGA